MTALTTLEVFTHHDTSRDQPVSFASAFTLNQNTRFPSPEPDDDDLVRSDDVQAPAVAGHLQCADCHPNAVD
jgi:hypothetical protein